MDEIISSLTPLVKRLILVSKIGCLLITFLSFVVLIGWELNIELLKSILPGILPMNPVEALCFVFASLALFLRLEHLEVSIPRLIIINSLSFLVLVVGVVSFLDNFYAFGFRPDKLLFPYALRHSLIAPNSAFNFALFGMALLVLNRKKIVFEKTQFFVLLAGVITMFAGIGYLYHALSFYKISIFSPMPLNTASAFALLCFCTLVSTHNRGMMKILTEDFVVSSLARRLILADVVLPVILGGLGTVTGLFFDPQTGTAFLVISQIIIFTLIIWFMTRALYKNELEKNNMTKSLQEKNIQLENTEVQLKQKMGELEGAHKEIKELLDHEKTLQDVMGNNR